MKSVIFVLALLMLALIVLPLAPYSGSSVGVVQSTDGSGECFACRNGHGMAGAMPDARNGMMRGAGTAMPSTPGARHGHERPEGSQVQQELQRDPFDWNTPVRAIRFHGYRRLSGKNILEHEKRQLIYTTILMNPGIEIPALATLTGINLHTLRYHLGYLMHMKKIACREQGGGYHFFENHGRYNPADQQRILYRRHPTTCRILTVIGENPGITRGEIAADLGLAGPSITRWTQRLIGEGVVTEVRDGRRVHYYPVQESGSTLVNT
ncbi:winged helix-turn-helix transcriptional regulator [Methanoregula sp.]|uniref:winged helix-turn-helix transcriptional regulator n=1 Tax=Methanoregula sp. TaxID=2052170 RepID=UPI00356A681B